MFYVVMDLEWNNVFVKRLNGFINEIIEVGAVLLDENLNEVKTFSCLVKSQLNRKLNSRVRELTHISNEQLSSEGVSFSKAMDSFSQWLGSRKTVFVTWGNCDIRSLLDNYEFFTDTGSIPFIKKYIDLQSYCQGIVASDTSNQIGLSTAAEKLGINPDDYTTHRALDDSLIAAECMRRTYDETRLDRYTEICDSKFFKRLKFKSVPVTDLEDKKIDKGLLRCKCDYCGKDMELYSDWKLYNTAFKSVFVCHDCNLFKKCTVRFMELTGGMDVKISYRTAHELSENDTNENI